jgi:tRNA(fMet)-specific endonuclease VapC
MTPYVLDTDILTLYREGDPNVVQRVNAHPLSELAVTVISVEEQLSGWYAQLRRAKRHDALARAYQQLTDCIRVLSVFRILSFTEAAILRYENLKAQKLNVGKMDLRIGAIVLECGGTLATRNVRDFQRIPQLRIEDWSARV